MKQSTIGFWLAIAYLSATCFVNVTRAANVDEFGAPLLDTQSRGHTLYQSHCAQCHSTGVAKAPHPRMLGFLSTASIYRALTSGVMRSQAAGLSEAEKIVIAESLTQRKLNTTKAQSRAPNCAGDAADFDWSEASSAPNWGLTWGNTREVTEPKANLNIRDIPKLTLRWAFEFPDTERARSHPLIAGGALFTGSQDGTVYALDVNTGCIRWTFTADAEVRTGIAFDSSRRLFFGDLLGRVYALDAQTGRELWRLRADDHPAATITGTPTVYQNRVYVPVSSLEVVSASYDDYTCCVFRGSVVALDANTGKQLWQTYSVAEPPTPRQRNSAGTQNYGPSGAPIWNSPTIDVTRGQLYVGTGENYSSPATNTSDAILAMDLITGKLRWSYQATARDAWNSACSGRQRGANCPEENGPDFDFGAAIVLARASNGKDILLGPQKSGIVHAVDPGSGKLIWKTKVGRGGLHGGVHFGIAVSGDRVFVPISDANDFRSYDEPANPGLFALDLKSGKLLWRAPLANECNGREFCDVGIGAAITATPSLVFAGALDGYLRIHDARSGKVLRVIDTTEPVRTVSGSVASGGSMDGGAAPLPYAGRLFVNSGYNFAGHMAGNVLLVYAFDTEANKP